MTFSFDKFSEIVTEKKVDIVQDTTSVNYPYMLMFGHFEVPEIDFNRLSVEGISQAHERISEAITIEDEDGQLLLDPNHPMYQILCLDYKMFGFEVAPKQVAQSSFRFI